MARFVSQKTNTSDNLKKGLEWREPPGSMMHNENSHDLDGRLHQERAINNWLLLLVSPETMRMEK